MNSVKRLALFNAGREPERLALKYQKMRASPFAFLRGSCHLFYERLTQVPCLPATPLVWAYGDLHLENFGSYQGDNRQVYFDINNFDEAALAPASWDLVRMLASLDVGLRDAGIKNGQVTVLSGVFITAYADELIGFGSKKAWRAKPLVAASVCAAQARKDAAAFNTAYDAGELRGD